MLFESKLFVFWRNLAVFSSFFSVYEVRIRLYEALLIDGDCKSVGMAVLIAGDYKFVRMAVLMAGDYKFVRMAVLMAGD